MGHTIRAFQALVAGNCPRLVRVFVHYCTTPLIVAAVEAAIIRRQFRYG
jgi:hypothetical protein